MNLYWLIVGFGYLFVVFVLATEAVRAWRWGRQAWRERRRMREFADVLDALRRVVR